MSRRLTLSIVLALVCMLPAVVSARPIFQVTACGQTVPRGHDGILTTDLTCPTDGGAIGVGIQGGALLDLQGHTITGGVAGVACLPVLCDNIWCGPTRQGGRCEVANGTITGARYEGVSGAKIRVRNMTITNNPAYGILAFHRADIIDSHVEGSVQANMQIRLVGTTIDGGSISVQARNVRLEQSSVTNGEFFGVAGRSIRLVASSVTGNATSPRCGVDARCADIVSETAPSLDAPSQCGSSMQSPLPPGDAPGAPWGTCTLD